MTTIQANLYVALRNGFPQDLDSTAVEVADGERLSYSWRDLERASARIANLLDSLQLPAGSRVAVQTEKCVEGLMLYLAVLRAGLVYLPLNPAYQAGELAYFLEDAEPAVVVCRRASFGWLSKCSRSMPPAAAACSTGPPTPASSTAPPTRRPTTWRSFSTPAAPPGAARGPCSRTATC